MSFLYVILLRGEHCAPNVLIDPNYITDEPCFDMRCSEVCNSTRIHFLECHISKHFFVSRDQNASVLIIGNPYMVS